MPPARSGLRSRLVAGPLAGAILALAGVAPAFAAFTDVAILSSNRISAATLGTPTGIGCVDDTVAGGMIVSWTAATTGAAHTVEIDSLPGGGGTWLTLGTAAVGATSFKIAPAQLASLLSLGATYKIRVVAVAGTSWRSAPSNTRLVQSISALGLVLGATCNVAGQPTGPV